MVKWKIIASKGNIVDQNSVFRTTPKIEFRNVEFSMQKELNIGWNLRKINLDKFDCSIILSEDNSNNSRKGFINLRTKW